MKKRMFTCLIVSTLFVLASCAKSGGEVISNSLRLPAVPLITIDPNTCAWSMTNNLYDGSVQHWTKQEFPLIGVAKVDGVAYRFMGIEGIPKVVVAPTSEQGDWTGQYTTTKPDRKWFEPSFDDSSWKSDKAAFGSKNEAVAKTLWNTEFIWVRRTIELNEDLAGKKIFLEYSHDDDVIIYINGIKVVDTGNQCHKHVQLELSKEVVASLKKGKNLIAAFCHDRGGEALLDFGLVMERDGMVMFDKTATQLSVDVQATQTHYSFDCGAVKLNLHFTAPMFMDDLDLLSRPVNYITYEIESKDGGSHDVEIYFEAGPAWALSSAYQKSETTAIVGKNGLLYGKAGSVEQKVLGKSGDMLCIDWGYFYMVADNKTSKNMEVGDSYTIRRAFLGSTDKADDSKLFGNNNMAVVRNLGKVKASSGKIMLGYDDQYSIQYFGDNVRPYWNRSGKETIEGQFEKANKEYASLMKKCYAFDKKLMEEATAAGGKQYAELCAAVYRQTLAAHKLIETPQGDLVFLSKENNSNGSIGTVDITYPTSPIFLYYNPELAKATMNHILYYSESGKWTKPFAAHDTGTYPWSNGQTYGGDMPVEESGNMLITAGAVAKMEGNAKYAEKHWKVLTIWTDYLVEYGLDPENQLCTDDFAGHFAHNANLSIKAIMGIASYAMMADMLGQKDVATKYNTIAKEMATKWVAMAADGDHYKLTFDKSGTWSQKYNLVWDKMMDLNIFPEDVRKTEIAYYLTKQNIYGLPLDNREAYTKTDWIMWTATMAADKAEFEKFIAPVHKFYNETPDRVPMSDWVYTDKPAWRGFQARSVVGGFYIKLLDGKMNKK